MANKCNAVFTSFPETAKSLKNGIFTGPPIRSELFEKDKIASKIRFGFPISAPVILVVGGGQGSDILNRAIRNCLPDLKEFSILHLCGKGNLVKTVRANYRQYEYLENIADAYAASDIVLSRAGSGAIFEILALKKPSVLVPLENASRGDQVENAEYFKRRGMCEVLRENELESLANTLRQTHQNEGLKRNLANSEFRSGNEKIIENLKPFLL